MTIKQLQEEVTYKLKYAQIDEASLKARLVISHVLKVPKEYIVTHFDDAVDSFQESVICNNIEKLLDGIPLEYITHKKEFMKLNFYVDENVLIPRFDTEILVEEVLKRCHEGKVLDLCTGSGAIAISIAKYMQNAQVTASDISTCALAVAKKNANDNGVNISFIESDLFEKISDKEFDVIVSNPPYIETDEINSLSKEVQKEPILALDGGKDGLNIYRKIITNAVNYLKENGLLALEIGYNQANKVSELIKDNGKYNKIEVIKDLSGNDRVILARYKNVVF